MKLTANIQGCGLGWVDLDFEYSTSNSDWADGNMQEAARKLGKMMEYTNLSKPTQVYEQMGHPVELLS